MRYVFGPVPSRRLGFSLGIDIIPHKTCTLDCLYCQLGATECRTLERAAYVDCAPVLEELNRVLSTEVQIDSITFSGSGEPTLNTQLGDMIAGIKSHCSIPVTVLTNGTLLHLHDVRRDLLRADIVCPSFDAATELAFTKINQPHEGLSLDLMIKGLRTFRQDYEGKIHLEVMLARGINDSSEELAALAEVLPAFGADRIQINTVVRPAAAQGVWAVGPDVLERARSLFGPAAEIIGGFLKEQTVHEQENTAERIISLVSRHPSTIEDIGAALGLSRELVRDYLSQLASQGRIASTVHGGTTYYKA